MIEVWKKGWSPEVPQGLKIYIMCSKEVARCVCGLPRLITTEALELIPNKPVMSFRPVECVITPVVTGCVSRTRHKKKGQS